MGKPLSSVTSTRTKLHHHLRRLTADTTTTTGSTTLVTKPSKPKTRPKMQNNNNNYGGSKSSSSGSGGEGGGVGGGVTEEDRKPLSLVVADCVRRWFLDALKEAKSGDVNMQVLVGQMYSAGYGVPKDDHRSKLWISRASKVRSTVWKVSDKRPGYNASDSESDEMKDES